MGDAVQAGFGRTQIAVAMEAALRTAEVRFAKSAALDLTVYDYKRQKPGWGVESKAVTGDGSGNATITFPVAFTTTMAVIACGNVAVTVTAFTATGFTVHGAVGAFVVHYLAVGV
jgi:hypothetical protein